MNRALHCLASDTKHSYVLGEQATSSHVGGEDAYVTSKADLASWHRALLLGTHLAVRLTHKAITEQYGDILDHSQFSFVTTKYRI